MEDSKVIRFSSDEVIFKKTNTKNHYTIAHVINSLSDGKEIKLKICNLHT